MLTRQEEDVRVFRRVGGHGRARRVLTAIPEADRDARRIWLATWMIVVDAALIFASFKLVSVGYRELANPPPVMLLATWVLVGFLSSSLALGVYQLEVSSGLQTVLERAGRAMVRAFVISGLAILLIDASEAISRVVFVTGFIIATITLLTHRALTYGWYRRFVAGAGSDTLILVDDAIAPPPFPSGLIVDVKNIRPKHDDPASLDRFARMVAGYDRIVVSCPPARRAEWAFVLHNMHLRGEIVATEIDELGVVGVTTVGGAGRFIVAEPRLKLHERVLKRMLDLSVVGIALIVLAPVLIGVAILIKLEDGGPVLFRQQRIGRANQFFEMLKFRSMKMARSDENAATLTKRGDDRLTRVGRTIRALSIDELPQLFNILRGEMSLVGPRPHALEAKAGTALYWEVDDGYWMRHTMKPGLTGLAQVRGFRGPTDTPHALTARLSSDLEYCRQWTLWRDLIIIARTLVVIRHENAF